MKNSKGITLIALVITIIVLLILAGVSIAMLTGENGLLGKATDAGEKTKLKNAEEAIKLVVAEWQIEKNLGKMTLEEFLNTKVPSELDDYEKISDNEYELEKDGYLLVIDADGNIIEGIQIAGVRPRISNIQITLEDGTEIEDNSQIAGTKLKITFDASIEDGQIIEVTPGTLLENGKVEYTTDGNEKTLSFTVKGEIEGNTYSKTAKISVESKYIISQESLIKAVEEITTSSANRPIQVEANGETVVYNTNTIVYDGNLTFDGTDKGITNLSLSNTTYSIGNPNNDVGTANSYAKNMVVLKVNGDLTINSGITLTACASANGYGGPKGLFIYCTGTLTNNGTIDMTARGAKAVGQNVYLYKNADNTFEYVPKEGAEGGNEAIGRYSYNNGTSGTKRQTGGGGTGGNLWGNKNNTMVAKAGDGTSYSGGSGSGGVESSENRSTPGNENGGSGGNGCSSNSSNLEVGRRWLW